jgi:hypothetical protein
VKGRKEEAVLNCKYVVVRLAADKMELRPFLRAKNSFVHLGGVAVTGLPLSGLVGVQHGKLFNRNNNNVCGEGFESLTPLHKRMEILWWGRSSAF